MIEIGYKLSSEEHGPRDLVANARAAEEAGFTFALISDHYHPWIDKQGESPFVWGVLGGIAQVTEKLRVGTGVTCPTMRIHPAVIAHAAATAEGLMPGRFFLGVGSGENLNEHILGDRWPNAPERLEMLEEAIDVIRLLWEGGLKSHRGTHYTVDHARLYSLPDKPPPLLVAASGPKASDLAGRKGDGLIGVAPDKEVIEAFRSSGGGDKPRYAEYQACWAPDFEQAQKTAFEWWPNSALGGTMSQDLKEPSLVEAAAEPLRQEDVVGSIACGPDPEVHLASIRKYADAGYTHICVHQIGPDQAGSLKFHQDEVLPKI